MQPRLKDIEAIYHAALEKAPGQDRTAYLDAACGTDTAIRCHVDALLAANDQAGAFLETLPWVGDVTLDASPVREGPGTVIGHYKLL